MIFSVCALALIAAMVLALIRAFRGPTVYDRILALNSFGTLTALMIAVVGFLMDRPDFLDLALVYVLINFIGPVAVLKFREYGEFGDSTEGELETRER